MSKFNEYCELLETLISFFDELTEITRRKLETIIINDVDQMEECMKEEQAASMKLRSLDTKRENLAKELGFAGLSIKEIVRKTEGTALREESVRIKDIFERLTKRVVEFKDVAKETAESLKIRLELVEKTMAPFEKKKTENDGYSPKGEKDKTENQTKKLKLKEV